MIDDRASQIWLGAATRDSRDMAYSYDSQAPLPHAHLPPGKGEGGGKWERKVLPLIYRIDKGVFT
jgi:hypothetical protein